MEGVRHIVSLLLMTSCLYAHITNVCTSTAQSQCAQKKMVFYFGTYHSISTGSTVPGTLHIQKPDGSVSKYSFGSVCASSARASGACPSADIVQNCPDSVAPSDASVTCYKAGTSGSAYAVQDTCDSFPATSGLYSSNKVHGYAVVTGATSGTYTLWTTGTDINFNPCSTNGYPCRMNSATSFTFELAVSGCGGGCASAPVIPGSTSSSVAPCANVFDGYVCAVQCIPGYLKYGGALICDNGVWRGDSGELVCSPPSTITTTSVTTKTYTSTTSGSSTTHTVSTSSDTKTRSTTSTITGTTTSETVTTSTRSHTSSSTSSTHTNSTSSHTTTSTITTTSSHTMTSSASTTSSTTTTYTISSSSSSSTSTSRSSSTTTTRSNTTSSLTSSTSTSITSSTTFSNSSTTSGTTTTTYSISATTSTTITYSISATTSSTSSFSTSTISVTQTSTSSISSSASSSSSWSTSTSFSSFSITSSTHTMSSSITTTSVTTLSNTTSTISHTKTSTTSVSSTTPSISPGSTRITPNRSGVPFEEQAAEATAAVEAMGAAEQASVGNLMDALADLGPVNVSEPIQITQTLVTDSGVITATAVSPAAADENGFVNIAASGGSSGGVQLAVPAAVLFQALAGSDGKLPMLTVGMISEDLGAKLNAAGEGSTGNEDPGPTMMAPPCSITLYYANGTEMKNVQLAEPMQMTMSVANGTNVSELKCAYWDEDLLAWSNKGVERVPTEDGSLVCATHHLTIFSAVIGEFKNIFNDIAQALMCNNAASLLSLDGLSALGKSSGWWHWPPAIALWVCSLVCILSLCVTGWLDWRDSKQLPWDQRHEVRKTTLDQKKMLRRSRSQVVPEPVPGRGNQAGRLRRSATQTGLGAGTSFLWVWQEVVGFNFDISAFIQEMKDAPNALVTKSVRLVHSRRAGMDEKSLKTLLTFNKDCQELQSVVPQTPRRQSVMSTVSRLSETRAVHDTGTAAADTFLSTCWPCRVCSLIPAVHPLMVLSRFSLDLSKSCRLALIISKIFASAAAAAMFFEASGGALDQESDLECTPRKGWVTEVIQAVTVGIACAFLGDVGMVILGMIQKASCWRGRCRRVRAAAFWFLFTLELLVCILFLAVFLANVSLASSSEWLHSSLISVLEELVLMPLCMALALALLSSAVLCCRPHVSEQIRSSWQNGNWARDDEEDAAQELAQAIDMQLQEVSSSDEDVVSEPAERSKEDGAAALRGMHHVVRGRKSGPSSPCSPRSPCSPCSSSSPCSPKGAWGPGSPRSPRRRQRLDNSSLLQQSQGTFGRSITSLRQGHSSELDQGRLGSCSSGRNIVLDSPSSLSQSRGKLASSIASVSQGKPGRSTSSVAMDVEVFDVDSFEVEGSRSRQLLEHVDASRSLARGLSQSQEKFGSSITSRSLGKFGKSVSPLAMDIEVADVDDFEASESAEVSRNLAPTEFVPGSASLDSIGAASVPSSLIPAEPSISLVPSKLATDPMDCIDIVGSRGLPGSASSCPRTNGLDPEEPLSPLSPRRRRMTQFKRSLGMVQATRRMRPAVD